MSPATKAAAEHSAPIGRVVTIATGQSIYHRLAENLIRSFLQWNHANELRFTLLTDDPARLPADLRGIELIPLAPGECGTGFSPKLHLDRFIADSPALFLDADCLVLGSLLPVFAQFRGQPFVILGEQVTSGIFYTDIAPLLAAVHLPWLPLFVGSFFYWEPGAVARKVFSLSRDYEARYDALGLYRMRGATADEPVMALALAHLGIAPLPDDGTLKADAHLYAYPPKIDVLRGLAHFPFPAQPRSRVVPAAPTDARPLVAHFNAAYAFESPYLREALILRLVRLRGWPRFAARAWARFVVDGPQRLVGGIKDLFRPAYHRLFGTRTIKPTPREI